MRITLRQLRNIIKEEFTRVGGAGRGRGRLREAPSEPPIDPPDSYWGYDDEDRAVDPMHSDTYETLRELNWEGVVNRMADAAAAGDSNAVLVAFQKLHDMIVPQGEPDWEGWNWITGEGSSNPSDDGLGFSAPGLQVYMDWMNGKEPSPQQLKVANGHLRYELDDLERGVNGYSPPEPDYAEMASRKGYYNDYDYDY